MRYVTTLVVLSLSLAAAVGCAKKEAPAAEATLAPSARASSAVPATAAAPTQAVKPVPQPGVLEGEVVIGYLQDPNDTAECVVLAVPLAQKEERSARLQEIADTLKKKLVSSCPTDKLVGTCKAFGALFNFSKPKYDPNSAKAKCAEVNGKWLDP